MDIVDRYDSLLEMLDDETFYDEEKYWQDEIYRDIRVLFDEDFPECSVGNAYWEVQYSSDQMKLLQERSTYFASMASYNPSDTNDVSIILPAFIALLHASFANCTIFHKITYRVGVPPSELDYYRCEC